MILDTRFHPDPILRGKCSPVVAGEDISNLIKNMVETMKASGGIGLAANQVGVSKQIVIIDVRKVQTPFSWVTINGSPVDAKKLQPLILINPEIKESGMVVKINEGCLSIPKQFKMVARKSIVSVTALDKNFNSINFEGILFIDYPLNNS